MMDQDTKKMRRKQQQLNKKNYAQWEAKCRAKFKAEDEADARAEHEAGGFLHFAPKEGQQFFYIEANHDVCRGTAPDDNYIAPAYVGVYKNTRAAFMEIKRRESRLLAWMPSKTIKYYYINISNGQVHNTTTDNLNILYANYLLGNCHATKEDAEKWIDDGYYEAFRCLLSII